jgi:hypothetical protein
LNQQTWDVVADPAKWCKPKALFTGFFSGNINIKSYLSGLKIPENY